jgi:hypothetical protein
LNIPDVVDQFYCKEVCPPKKPTKSKFNPRNVFGIPKPNELILQIDDTKKVDLAKHKKQQNVIKLKKLLAQKLWDRKILELKQMPFDSSKEAFHDHMDMFFMAKDA